MELDYQEQSLGSLIGNIIEDTIETLNKSSHNPSVFKHLLKAKKSRGFAGLINETYVDLIENPNTIARDITKSWCHTSIMYSPIEEWIKLDFNDDRVVYNGGNIELGSFYVETRDITLIKNPDLYSSAIIKKASDEGIPFEITHQLITKNRERKDLFVQVIDKNS